MQVLVPSKELASKHYAEHDGKPFFPKLVDFLSSGAVVATVWEGKEVVKYGRTLIGVTNPLASAPGTVRYAAQLFPVSPHFVYMAEAHVQRPFKDDCVAHCWCTCLHAGSEHLTDPMCQLLQLQSVPFHCYTHAVIAMQC